MKKILPLFIVLILSGCFSNDQNVTKEPYSIGNMRINYYSDKSVTSLEVPPDLTNPDYQNSFRLSEFSKGVKEDFVNFTNKNLDEEKLQILKNPTDVQVKRSGSRRWLFVKKSPEVLWELSKDFLKSEGFTLNRLNKKTGIIETDYLENREDIPDRPLGVIRSLINKATGQSYSLPVLDKYKLRIEPITDESAEIYLSLSSMQETVQYDPQSIAGKDETTIWQFKEKDTDLETEMLYRLMVFLGADNIKEKIINSEDEIKLNVKFGASLNGFSMLTLDTNFINSWDYVSWALDQLDIFVEDKDILEKAFYIQVARTSDKGIFSKIFGDDAIKKTFQLRLNEISENETNILFYDISEENEPETKDFSIDLMKQIANVIKN